MISCRMGSIENLGCADEYGFDSSTPVPTRANRPPKIVLIQS